MTDTNSAKNGAEALLSHLEFQQAECIFTLPIPVMARVWEALTWRASGTKQRYFRCGRECLAVRPAIGYYTGRAQISLIPTSLGVQNASMALSTPQRERYPHIAAISEQGFVDNVIQPAPDYLKQVEAYGGTGERVLKTERGICGALEASRRAAVFAGGRRQPGGDR